MTQHTPEPWGTGQYDAVRGMSGMLLDASGDHIGTTFNGPEDARRIVACVNACEGMTTDELDTLPRGFKRLQAAYLDLYNERTTPAEKARDELLAALQAMVLFTAPKKNNAAALNNALQIIAKHTGGAA